MKGEKNMVEDVYKRKFLCICVCEKTMREKI